MAKVAGYYRISQARDGMQAPELYEDEIRRFCSFKGYALAEIFSDIDRSGYNRSESRPALGELVTRRAEFSGVVVPKLSRFGRSVKHLSELFALFDNDNIALHFLDLGMDTSTSQGRLLRHIMAAFAEYESAVRGDYTRANNRRVAQSGRPWGGPAPFGYRRGHGTYEIDPEAAEVVRLMFRLYKQGLNQFNIARELYGKGIPTPGGSPMWPAGRIGRYLDNPAYAGMIPHEGQLLPGNWEPLIDTDTWQAVDERRKANRKKWSKRRDGGRLLTGLIYCGDCGRHAYYVASGRGDCGRYRCGRDDVVLVCEAPSTNSTRAERFVTDAFLARAEMLVMHDGQGRFVAARQWERSTTSERRMLLAAVIERVVMVPIAKHPGSGGRPLVIEWKQTPTEVLPPPVRKGVVGTGRALALARDQREEMERKARARTERSMASKRDWVEMTRRTRIGNYPLGGSTGTNHPIRGGRE